jgi:hypothetical protein
MFRTRRASSAVAAIAGLLALGAQADPVFTASLDGAQNLPEPLKTAATGTAELALSGDRKSIAFRISVTGLANAASADIHLGPTFQNGPVVAKLWTPGAAKQGEFSGLLASGTIAAADLIGPLTGAPLADLVEELEAGKVYVNVHTNDGADPPNSGPGDYRLGEIRGQLK